MTQYRLDLAFTLDNLSDRLSGEGRVSEATQLLREATGLWQGLHSASPENLGLQGRLNATQARLGVALARSGQAEEAFALLDESIERQRDLADRDPATPGFRRALGRQYGLRAEALLALDRPSEAAEAVMARWSSGPEEAGDWYAIARDLSRCVSSLERRPDPGDDQLPEKIRLYGGRALEALRRAASLSKVEGLRAAADPAFAPIAANADFRLLLLDLAFPADPFVR